VGREENGPAFYKDKRRAPQSKEKRERREAQSVKCPLVFGGDDLSHISPNDSAGNEKLGKKQNHTRLIISFGTTSPKPSRRQGQKRPEEKMKGLSFLEPG